MCSPRRADNERDVSENGSGGWLAASGRQRAEAEAAQEDEAECGGRALAADGRRRGVDDAIVGGGGLVVGALGALVVQAVGGLAWRQHPSALPAGDPVRQVGHQDVVLGALSSGICQVCFQVVYLLSIT